MQFCRALKTPFNSNLAAVVLAAFLVPALAYADCETLLFAPLTHKALDQRWQTKLAQITKTHPLRGSDYIENEIDNEQPSETGPKAFQDMIGPYLKFASTPEASSPFTSVVHHFEGKSTFPVDAEVEWHGRKTTTTVFASLPKMIRPTPSGRLISKRDYPVVLVHLHGGGTATANGKNGMSIAQALEKLNIPVLAPDMPGHGRATSKIDGFAHFKDQADWLLKLIDQMVDPDVKIVLSGHSWGGEFAVFMQRLSYLPEYKRFSKFISLAPPVDVSMGGDVSRKAEFEEWFAKAFPSLNDKSSEKDMDFTLNVRRYGKDANIPGMFCQFTDNEFSLPTLSPEQQAGLTELQVVIPRHDLVTYVGRETEAEQNYGSLALPSKLTFIEEGHNFQNPPNPNDPNAPKLRAGHGAPFDIYEDGTTSIIGYKMIAEWVLGVVPGGVIKSDPTPVSKAETSLQNAFLYYANHFTYREMLKGLETYASLNSRDKADFASKFANARDLVKKLGEREVTEEREFEKFARGPLVTELAKKHGLDEILNINRLDTELKFRPLTEARKVELEKYVADVAVADQETKELKVDSPEVNQMLAKIKEDFAPVIARLKLPGDLSGYAEKRAALERNKKNLDKQQKADFSDLSRLQQRMREVEAATSRVYNGLRDARVAQVKKPEGVVDVRAANWELNPERSDARTDILKKISAEYPAEFERRKVERLAAVHAEIMALPRIPEGTSNAAELRAHAEDLSWAARYAYVPAGRTELQPLADEINGLLLERKSFAVDESRGLNSIEKWVAEMRKAQDRRGALFKSWDKAIKESDVSSPLLNELGTALEADFQELNRTKDAYDELEREFIRRLLRTANLDEKHVRALSPEIKAARALAISARDRYMKAASELEVEKMRESVAGHLTGSPEDVARVQNAATQLFGQNYPEGAPGSAVSVARDLEDKVESLRQRLSLIDQSLDALQAKYAEAIHALPESENQYGVPDRFERVNILELLDQGYAQTMQSLESAPKLSALDKSLLTFDSFIPDFNREAQSKDPANY